MKKLNITKERFEKSRYFQKKYGKLEYVSESGKLFKTSKGKLLKFKESKESKQMNEGVFGDIGDSIDDGIRGIKKFFHKAKFKKGDKVMICMGDFSPPGVKHGLEVIDTQYGGWSGGWEYRTGTDDWGNPEWWPEVRVALDTDPDGGYEEYDPEKFPEFKKMEKYIKKPSKESTKKFGKKFNESEDSPMNSFDDETRWTWWGASDDVNYADAPESAFGDEIGGCPEGGWKDRDQAWKAMLAVVTLMISRYLTGMEILADDLVYDIDGRTSAQLNIDKKAGTVEAVINGDKYSWWVAKKDDD